MHDLHSESRFEAVNFCTPREDDLREGFPVPHDIFSNLLIVSSHAVKVIFISSEITLLELTNQVALLKQLSYGLKLKMDFKRLSLEETHL